MFIKVTTSQFPLYKKLLSTSGCDYSFMTSRFLPRHEWEKVAEKIAWLCMLVRVRAP